MTVEPLTETLPFPVEVVEFKTLQAIVNDLTSEALRATNLGLWKYAAEQLVLVYNYMERWSEEVERQKQDDLRDRAEDPFM